MKNIDNFIDRTKIAGLLIQVDVWDVMAETVWKVGRCPLDPFALEGGTDFYWDV